MGTPQGTTRTENDLPYFDFSGGISTDSTPTTADNNTFKDALNIEVDRDKTVFPRRAIDFFGGVGNLYTKPTEQKSTNIYGSYVAPAISTTNMRVKRGSGDSAEFLVVVAYPKIYIYSLDYLLNLGEADNYSQVVDISSSSSKKSFHHKTKFSKDGNRVYLINPYIEFSYLEYNVDTGQFEFSEEDIFVRTLVGDNVPADSYVNLGGKNFKCIKSHVSLSNTKPESGSDWEQYWVENGAEVVGGKSWRPSVSGTEIVYNVGDLVIDLFKVYRCKAKHVPTDNNRPFNGGNSSTYWDEIDVPVSSKLNQSYDTWEKSTKSVVEYTSNVTSYKDRYLGGSDSNFSDQRFRSSVLASGRLWLSGLATARNTVFFSQTVTDRGVEFNRMYQFADPFNSDDNVVVDTDGGTIIINGAEEILGLAEIGQGVVVFATNGVWFINGASGFRATDFSVDKISSEGLVGRDCFVEVEGGIVYFGKADVFAVTFGDISTLPKVQKISGRIDNLYNSIDVQDKSSALAHYDPSKKRVYFFTNFNTQDWLREYKRLGESTYFRDYLVFDVDSGGWFKHSLVPDTSGYLPSIADVFSLRGSFESLAEVTLSDGTGVTLTNGEGLTVVDLGASNADNITGALVLKRDGDYTKFAFCRLGATGTVDFSKNPEDASEPEAYFKTPQYVVKDIRHKKHTPKLTALFERVESGEINPETNEDTTPGGCLLRMSRDFSNSSRSVKWGEERQIYLPHRGTLSYFDGSDTGSDYVTYSGRIRGSGVSFQFVVRKEAGKDFRLVGLQLTVGVSKRV